MSYEPERRYSRDRAHQLEIDKPFDSQPRNDRGQFWNISRSVRGAATGAGFAGGWWFAATDPFEIKDVVNGILGGDWFMLVCLVGGGLLGFIGGTLRRKGLIP
jgi:hypothetical protein